MNYLIDETDLTKADKAKEISIYELQKVKAVDVNIFLDYCRSYRKEDGNTVYYYENNNKSLARKKSSISVLFKQLYRDELVEKNITDGFDPIRVPKPQEKEIKALQDDEVMITLDAVSNGTGLTKKEQEYWEKTKLRDKAILIIFLTYGLRLSELQQMNVSSFNFQRGEFKIYRKRGKESSNATVLDMHTIKPIDEKAVIDVAKNTGNIVVCEEAILPHDQPDDSLHSPVFLLRYEGVWEPFSILPSRFDAKLTQTRRRPH